MKSTGLSKSIVLLIVLNFVSLLLASHTSMALAAEGTILSPQKDGQVDGVYEASGTIKGLLPGNILWIAVRKGNNFWPKDEAFVVGGEEWTAQVDESATRPGGPYSLVLFSVNPEGQTAILDWRRINEEDERWPAMVGRIKGAEALDMVNVRRK